MKFSLHSYNYTVVYAYSSKEFSVSQLFSSASNTFEDCPQAHSAVRK